METIIKTQMEGRKFGEIQIHKHVTVIPMIGNGNTSPDYLTMKEAMEGHPSPGEGRTGQGNTCIEMMVQIRSV